jgi:hypothetical protein
LLLQTISKFADEDGAYDSSTLCAVGAYWLGGAQGLLLLQTALTIAEEAGPQHPSGFCIATG